MLFHREMANPGAGVITDWRLTFSAANEPAADQDTERLPGLCCEFKQD